MYGVNIQIYIVDAFSDVPFKGNSCAVCLLPTERELPDDFLRQIANEMNKSEVAFIKCINEGDTFETGASFGLRWFIPETEIKMCGNGTLSSAAVLLNKIGNKQDRIVFKTLSGDLIVRREGEFLHMDFPVGYAKHQNLKEYEQMTKALGDIPGVEDIVYCFSLNYLLIRLQDGWTMKQFEEWVPDYNALRASTAKQTRVVIVTTRGDRDQGYVSPLGTPYDFVSRCFTPWTTVIEHQATGSTQTVLIHYWSQQLGKKDFVVKQSSQRGGEFFLKLRNDRVELKANATIVMEGVLSL